MEREFRDSFLDVTVQSVLETLTVLTYALMGFYEACYIFHIQHIINILMTNCYYLWQTMYIVCMYLDIVSYQSLNHLFHDFYLSILLSILNTNSVLSVSLLVDGKTFQTNYFQTMLHTRAIELFDPSLLFPLHHTQLQDDFFYFIYSRLSYTVRLQDHF